MIYPFLCVLVQTVQDGIWPTIECLSHLLLLMFVLFHVGLNALHQTIVLSAT